MPISGEEWQEISWDGVSLRLPVTWSPTVIHKSYLFFEEEGQPAFAIKWNRIRGRFSAHRILDRLQESVKNTGTSYSPAPVPEELLPEVRSYEAAGFVRNDSSGKSNGLLLFCRHCRRSSMLQFYPGSSPNAELLHDIVASFKDHPRDMKQNWFMYDIRARLPKQAKLQTHEFLAGRYTLTFALPDTEVSLYRFKPAATILTNQSLADFGSSLAGKAVCVGRDKAGIASWEFEASWLGRLGALVGRKPAWIWLRLEHIEEKNAIIAVKGSGKGSMNRKLMEDIAEDFDIAATG